MDPQALRLLAPMGALAALTFLVLQIIPFMRFRAAFAGRVKAEDFRLGESARVPGDVALPNRNYMNLLELPVLFYALCVICLVTHRIDNMVLALAWVYVTLRTLHSLVHVTYNNVFHRLSLFAASSLVLVCMWIYVYVKIYA